MLLDTHVVLWALADPDRLGQGGPAIADPDVPIASADPALAAYDVEVIWVG